MKKLLHFALLCLFVTSLQAQTENSTETTQDYQAPTRPVDLIAVNTTETATDLSWRASVDNYNMAGYRIYKDGVLIETISQTNLVMTNLSPNTTYTFMVKAFDTAGNESEPSNDVTTTTLEDVELVYCDSHSADVNEEHIGRVQFESIDNESDGRFYSDFTNISTDIVKNGQCIINITPRWTNTPYTEGYSVWIDYNQNGDFNDPGEQVWIQDPTTEPVVTGRFTVPTSAPNGITRMRVSMKYDAIPLTCETFTYGEVEDYTVNIISASPDTIPPVISLNEEEEVEIYVNDEYIDAGATAIDNIDGDISHLIDVTGNVNTAEEGTYTLSYNVRDVVGNSATEVTRTINVIRILDEIAPEITLNGAEIIEINVGDTFTDEGATAMDNIDGDITPDIISSGNVDTASAGIYAVRYNVSDAAGNAATEVTCTVKVNEVIVGCTSGIDAFPYAESYENTLGNWTQSSDDDINWTVDANGTPSNGTGPANATEGNSYIFVEASGNGTGYPNKQAVINSPCYDLTNETNATFSFSYHMYGSNDMGTIAVEVSNDNGVSWTTVWNESGNKGNSWMNASIDLSEYVGGGIQLRFNRITGGTWKADIAIDNIALTTGYVAARQEAVATKVKDSPTTTKNKETVAVEEFYEEEELNTLTVFPNPVRGNILNIKLDTGSATSYRITNLYGQAVLAGTASNQIKVDRLKSGIYFIEVSDGTNTLTKKFIKQ